MTEPNNVAQSCLEILEHIRSREAEAALLPLGPIRQAAFLEIARLRADAVAQQLLASAAPAQIPDDRRHGTAADGDTPAPT